MTDELLYLWFGMIGRLTHTVKMNIAMHYGGLKSLWDIKESTLRSELTGKQADAILEYRNEQVVVSYEDALRRRGVMYTYPGDKYYPERLYDIPDPPLLLFAMGNMDILRHMDKALAVVGARKASMYGRGVAERMITELAGSGITIVSGMALGIDGIAHRSAIETGSDTVAVLGSGINVPYPAENRDIYQRICAGAGVVVSEYGLDVRPDAFRFPYRNRIISGMSDGVLVIEAREKSGSLITADQALEQGRDVYAVPGRVTDTGSSGCNNLIKMGAGCATCAGDILDSFGIKCLDYAKKRRPEGRVGDTSEDAFNKKLLAPAEKKVYSCVRLEPRHVDDICLESGISVSEVTQILFDLEQKKLVKQLVRNYYIRI